MPEITPNLKTFNVQITEDGESRIEKQKAFSLANLIGNFQLMGYEENQIKVLGEIKTEAPVPLSVRPQGTVNSDTGPITLLDVADVPENVQKAVAANLSRPVSPQPITIQDTEKYVPVPDAPPPSYPETVTSEAVTQKTMIWKDGKIEFKLDAGVLSKKVWSKIGLKKLESDHGIKVRFKFDEKKIPSSEYTIEIMEWMQVEQS